MTTWTRRRACAVPTAAIWLAARAASASDPADIAGELAALAADPAMLARTRAYRELDFRITGPSESELRAQPTLPPSYASHKTIADEARALIVIFEVTSQALYQARYARPTWPGGNSGVTIGIGYDLGYVAADRFRQDWSPLLDPSAIEMLASCCGTKGGAAGNLPDFLAGVSVPWPMASTQFGTALTYVAGETLHAFPNASHLSPASFGALVSLVYNRGSGMRSAPGDRLDRRREMRAARDHIASGAFAAVPDDIRAMRRLWAGDPNAQGLVRRRQAEADLFERGLG